MSLNGPTIFIRKRTFLLSKDLNGGKEDLNGEVTISKNELIEVMKLLKGIERKLQAKIDKA